MGSLREKLEAMGESQLGGGEWSKLRRQVAAFWRDLRGLLLERIEQELSLLKAGPEKVRIYQDGLPAGGEIGRKIVEEIAERGSPNYQIIRELLERGAQLEKTEHAGLLQEEYGWIAQIVNASSSKERERLRSQYRLRSARLLQQRDRFIAKAIDTSLREGELGILFLGASHRVAPHLPADIGVIRLNREIS